VSLCRLGMVYLQIDDPEERVDIAASPLDGRANRELRTQATECR
jgi:hypothetical protein